VRRLLEAGGCSVEEVEYTETATRCCGRGSGLRRVDPELYGRIAGRRVAESSRPWVTYCAGCRDAFAGRGAEAAHVVEFLLARDWRRTARGRAPGRLRRYARRLRTKRAFRKLRPLGAE
jgi:Fe-S oxidoreductase